MRKVAKDFVYDARPIADEDGVESGGKRIGVHVEDPLWPVGKIAELQMTRKGNER